MSAPEERTREQTMADEELVEDLEAPVSVRAKVEGGLPCGDQTSGCGGYIDGDGGAGWDYDTKGS